jgi:citrate lyase subunit beta / citryl-CoA lyase
MLFVPGHKPSWVPKAIQSGADALILDLEDSVPMELKEEARRAVHRTVLEHHEATDQVSPDLWVRTNAWESGLVGLDLEAVTVPGIAGFFLPKVYGVDDLIRFDGAVQIFERRSGLEVGKLRFLVSLETASSIAQCEQLALAPRVASLFGATARDADISRALGITWTQEGLETLYIRSRILLACRAAGLEHPMCGLWQEVHDLEGLQQFANANRSIGYRGQVVIHPSHVPIVNEVFALSDSELAFYRGLIEAFETAERQGSAATVYEGQHVDIAHMRTAQELIARAERLRHDLPSTAPPPG